MRNRALLTLVWASFTCWCLSLGFAPERVQADTLRRMEKETRSRPSRSSSSSKRSSSSSHSSHSYYDSSDDNDLAALAFVYYLGYFLASPWIVPHKTLEPKDDALYSRECFRGFAAYPYADGKRGLLRSSCEENAELRPVAFGVGMESGWMNGEVVPAALYARLLLWKRGELSLRTDSLLEVGAGLRDQAFMTTGHASVRFAESKHMDVRMGLGPRSFTRKATRWGADLLYGMDIYGKRPIVARLEFHAGSLRRTFVGQFRGTLGVMLGRTEIYAGYDHTYLTDGQGDGVPLRGPIAGARGWF